MNRPEGMPNSALLTDAYYSALRATFGAANRERYASQTYRGP